MPYVSNADLPASVRRHLPTHAQDIFREAYNHAFDRYAAVPRSQPKISAWIR